MTSPTIRPATAADLDTIRDMNEAAVPHVNSVPRQFLSAFLDRAAYFRVSVVDGNVAGFLIGLSPNAQYDSLNFLWFTQHYESFVYVDRIVTAAWARRRGVARSLYRDIIEFTRAQAPVLTCEVNLQPPNPSSITFHASFGFTQVGTQDTEGGAKTVSLMALDMGRG